MRVKFLLDKNLDYDMTIVNVSRTIIFSVYKGAMKHVGKSIQEYS